MVKINGEPENAEGKNIAEVLAEIGFNDKRVAVELNENIVPRVKYSETFLEDGDTLEIVRFVGGG